MRVLLTLVLFLGMGTGSFAADAPAAKKKEEPKPPSEVTLPRVRNTQLGMTARYRNRFWVPLKVDIENPGPEREAYLVSEALGHYCRQVVQFTRPIWLPPQAVRSVTYPVLADSSLGEIKVPAEEVMLMKLTDGGVQVWDKQTVLGSPQAEESFLVLLSDARYSVYKFIDKIGSLAQGRPIARSVCPPGRLPRHVMEYGSIEVLILSDVGKTPLTSLQMEALQIWVQAGGCLVFTPSPDLDVTAMNDWLPLLPVTYESVQPVATLPDLERWGPAGIFQENLAFGRMIVRDGRVVLGTTERPLAVVRPEGLGQVVCLAFDTGNTSFQTWEGAPNFYRDLFNSLPRFFQGADRILERSRITSAVLSHLAGVKVLSRRAILGYLALAVGGVILVLLVFRLTRAPEWGWVLGVVLAVGGGVATIVGAARWKGQPQPYLNEVYLATGKTGVPVANVYGTLGLFSPREMGYQLRMPNELVSIRPGRSDVVPPQLFSVSYKNRLTVEGLRVRADEMRLMFGRSPLTPAAKPEATLHLGPEGLDLAVTNDSAKELQDCFIKFNRFVLSLGDLPPQRVVKRERLRGAEAGAELAYTSRLVRTPEDELRSRIRQIFFPDPVYTLSQEMSFEEWMFQMRFRPRGERPALYGWRDERVFPVEAIDPPVARRSVGMWAIEAPVTYATDRVLLPKGVLGMRMRDKAAIAHERAEGRFSGTRPMVLLAEFQLPPDCPDLAVDRARVFVAFRGDAFRTTVRIAPRELVPAAEPDAERFVALTGGPVYVIEDPQQYYHPDTRSFLVAVSVDVSPEVKTQDSIMPSLRYWQIRDLDIEVGGSLP